MSEAEGRPEPELSRGGWFSTGTALLSRRTVLRGSLFGGAGLAAAALIGCGDDDDDDDAGGGTATGTATATGTGTAEGTATAAPEEPDYVTRARADGAPFAYNYPEPSDAPRAGGTMVGTIRSGHSPFDPVTSAGATTESANSMLGDFLVGYTVGPALDKFAMQVNGETGLAQSWEVSPDGLTLTFDIRNPNFHNIDPVNGRPLVAQDVKLAYERYFGGRQAGILGTIDSVDAPDDATVVFNMKTPNPDILVIAGNRAVPIYAPETYDNGTQDATVVGTGPALLDTENTVKDQVLAFKSNAEYWGGAPLLDGFNLVTVPDDETRKALFRTGQSHMGHPALLPDELKNFFDEMPGMQVTADPNLAGITVYAVNSNLPQFQDERVRQALKLGMDVERYIAIRNPGFGAESFPAFGWPFLFDEAPDASKFGDWWAFNPDEAKKLLAAAGAEGLTFTHIGPAQFSGGTDSQDALLIEDMAAIGVTMNYKNIDFSVFNAQYYGQQWWKGSAEAESIQGWSTATPTANGYFWENIHSQSSTNHFAINDPEVDRLADAQRSELDPAARREIQLELYNYINNKAYLMDKLPITWSITMFRPEARGYRFNAPYIGLHVFWDQGYGYNKASLGDALTETPSIVTKDF